MKHASHRSMLIAALATALSLALFLPALRWLSGAMPGKDRLRSGAGR